MPTLPNIYVILRLVFVGAVVLLAGPSWAAPSSGSNLESATPSCETQDRPQASFTPRAYTLVSVYVRDKAPEYSFMRGQWILGKTMGVVHPKTCLQILKREEIGVIQIWFLVRYLDTAKQVRTGWIWAGTKGKDEGSFIGGDITPKMSSREPMGDSSLSALSSFFVSTAFAQGDTFPPPATVPEDIALLLPKSSATSDLIYLVELPFLGWTVSYSTISALVLFVAMLAGMMAKAIWDETGGERGKWPAWNKMFRPFLVSPIAFSAFWGPMYVQQDGGGLSLTMALYAFQIGFMWQHVLERKVGGN